MIGLAKFLAGAALVVSLALIAHGPLGFGDRFIDRLADNAQTALAHAGGADVRVTMDRTRPLRRIAIIHGPPDHANRAELVAAVGRVPGVAAVRWQAAAPAPVPTIPVPAP